MVEQVLLAGVPVESDIDGGGAAEGEDGQAGGVILAEDEPVGDFVHELGELIPRHRFCILRHENNVQLFTVKNGPSKGGLRLAGRLEQGGQHSAKGTPLGENRSVAGGGKTFDDRTFERIGLKWKLWRGPHFGKWESGSEGEPTRGVLGSCRWLR